MALTSNALLKAQTAVAEFSRNSRFALNQVACLLLRILLNNVVCFAQGVAQLLTSVNCCFTLRTLIVLYKRRRYVLNRRQRCLNSFLHTLACGLVIFLEIGVEGNSLVALARHTAIPYVLNAADVVLEVVQRIPAIRRFNVANVLTGEGVIDFRITNFIGNTARTIITAQHSTGCQLHALINATCTAGVDHTIAI